MQNWEQLREQVKQKLFSKEIVIWGADKHTKCFLEKYADILSVKLCVADACENGSVLLVNNREIPVCSISEYVPNDKDYIIVSREQNPFGENYLEMQGYIVFEHYIRDEWIAVFLQQKKVAFFAGNCLTLTLADCVMRQKRFAEEYACFWAPIHKYLNKYSRKTWILVKNYADVYVYAKHHEKNQHFFAEEELSPKSQQICVPTYYATMYWPQMADALEDRNNPYYIKTGTRIEHGPFEILDTNLNSLLEKGYSVEEIVALVSSETFYAKEDVVRHMAEAKMALCNADKDTDVKASEYILSNLDKAMFVDPVHPTIELDVYMSKQILNLIGFSESDFDADGLRKFSQKYENHTTQIPIYPSVREALEMEDKDVLYNVTYYDDRKRMVTFEEYVRGYCESTKRAMEISRIYRGI